MPRRVRKLTTLAACFSAITFFHPIIAHALVPSEILVIYNPRSAQSLSVAQYYMHARAIPRENLLGVPCTTADSISEEEYRQTVLPIVRKALEERPPDHPIKCLAPVFGMPLMIGPAHAGAAEKAEAADDQKRLDEILLELADSTSQYDLIASNDPQTPPNPLPGPPATRPQKTLPEIVAQLNIAANAAARRIEQAPESQRPHEVAAMEHLHERIAGIAGVLAIFQVRDDSSSATAGHEHLNELQTKLNTLNAQMHALSADLAPAKNRNELLALQLQAHGLLGEVQELQSFIKWFSPTETEACFDNELALVAETREYPLTQWLANPNNVEFYPSIQHQPPAARLKTLLVSRLDGLTRDGVIRMIDTSLKVEKIGLDGKLYLDARGRHGTDAYAAYDADIRAAADWVKNNSTMDVVLEDTEALFQAKDCPQAALYCGWYSLRNYQPSCQWLPGAVGYHVASYEMESLHDEKETGWVVNLLSHGFCGTLGATSEPYLNAFPKPSKFFPLLLSGLFTQGEVWQVTSPMVSWRIGYVGDPLYNPFKNKPRVTESTLRSDTVLRNAFEILRKN